VTVGPATVAAELNCEAATVVAKFPRWFRAISATNFATVSALISRHAAPCPRRISRDCIAFCGKPAGCDSRRYAGANRRRPPAALAIPSRQTAPL